MQDRSVDEIIRTALQASHARLRKQHELCVHFGVGSLHATSLLHLQTQACAVVAQGMGTAYAKVLKYQSTSDRLVLESGVGWHPSDIGTATLGADDSSPAGYAYMTDRPVISNHLGDELRFRTPELLKKYGIERAINVPIRGTGSPLGVLEADSPEGGDFIESDLVFMQGIATIIAMTAERLAAQVEQYDPAPYSESVLNSSPDCVKIISTDGRIEFFNETGLCQMGLLSLDAVKGSRWEELWPEPARAQVERAIRDAAEGNAYRFESFCPTANGEPRWWDVTVAPIKNSDHQVDKLIAVSRDISERYDQETKLKALIEAQSVRINENHLMIEEIHHRVKNSLHLVNTLLILQANMASEETVKLQLKTAANRVMTVASVHERLYQSLEATVSDPRQFLTSLLQDIGEAFGDREIVLESEPLEVAAERLAPLGFVTSELVINALKYGKGKVVIGLRRQDDHAVVTVSDEGEGFPDSYPKPSGTGLGMRLVKSYSGFGSEAITVERNAPTSTIHVKFRL
jgi:PAS domain S-box-containing protein